MPNLSKFKFSFALTSAALIAPLKPEPSCFAPFHVIWWKNGRIKKITPDTATQARMVCRTAD
jgi:hypothetical protein